MAFTLAAGACSTWPAWCLLSSKARAAAIKSINLISCRRARLRRFCKFPAKMTWLAISCSTSVKLQDRASCRSLVMYASICSLSCCLHCRKLYTSNTVSCSPGQCVIHFVDIRTCVVKPECTLSLRCRFVHGH